MTILEAKLTRDTETFGKMDPYAVVNYLGREIGRTKVHEDGGKTPKWG